HISAAFTSQGPGSIGLRFVLETRPPCAAFYAVPVRQTEVLPSEVFFLPNPASFRFRLTTDTLAFG
ncbi:MAG: hypothetical protein IJL25_10705, partial [Clostridia bacterium]|nr:hypothetical protein [Clostridia bacterium]